MKKIMLLLGLFAGACFTISAQKLAAAKVPAAAMTSFAKQYPGVAGKWEKEAGKYEVNFTQKGIAMSVLMDEKGRIAETEMGLKISDLPTSVLAYVKQHYSGKIIKEGAKITKADGTVNYEAEVSGKDVIFDSNGKFLKEVKD